MESGSPIRLFRVLIQRIKCRQSSLTSNAHLRRIKWLIKKFNYLNFWLIFTFVRGGVELEKKNPLSQAGKKITNFNWGCDFLASKKN